MAAKPDWIYRYPSAELIVSMETNLIARMPKSATITRKKMAAMRVTPF